MSTAGPTPKKEYVQGLRFLCILMVALGHFCQAYAPAYYAYGQHAEHPVISLFLSQITGKVGVAFFCLLTGYFGYRSFRHRVWRGEDREVRAYALKYVCTRYFRFFLLSLLAGLLMCAGSLALRARYVPTEGILPENLALSSASIPNIPQFLRSTLLLDGTVVPSLWLLQPIFVCNVVLLLVMYLSRKQRERQRYVALLLAAAACALLGQLWVCLCFSGVLYAILEERGSRVVTGLGRRWKIAFLLAAFACDNLNEQVFAFLIDEQASSFSVLLFHYGYMPWLTLAAFLCFAVLNNSATLQRVLSFRPLVRQGDASFEFYAVHVPVFLLFSPYLFRLLPGALPLMLRVCITGGLTLALLCVLSRLLWRYVTTPAVGWAARLYDKAVTAARRKA